MLCKIIWIFFFTVCYLHVLCYCVFLQPVLYYPVLTSLYSWWNLHCHEGKTSNMPFYSTILPWYHFICHWFVSPVHRIKPTTSSWWVWFFGFGGFYCTQTQFRPYSTEDTFEHELSSWPQRAGFHPWLRHIGWFVVIRLVRWNISGYHSFSQDTTETSPPVPARKIFDKMS